MDGAELEAAAPVVLRPGEGEVITNLAERTIRILADREGLALSWFRYEPGQEGPDPHVHHRHLDAFYVLDGELELGLGPDVERLPAPAGSLVAAPPDVVHTFRNVSDATAVFLNIHAPAMGFVEMLRARRDGRDADALHFDQFAPPPDGGRPLADAVLSRPGEGERTPPTVRFLMKAARPELTLLEFEVEPEFGTALHRHREHHDAYYVLEGELEVRIEDATVVATEGTFVSVPPAKLHTWVNAGPVPTRFLNLHAPGGWFERYVRERAEIELAGGEPDGSFFARHDILFAG